MAAKFYTPEAQLRAQWDKMEFKPSVIALDLDHTLWPFYTDLDTRPPLKQHVDESSGQTSVINSDDTQLNLFPDVVRILDVLSNLPDVRLAVASKALNYSRAHELLDLFEIRKYFVSVQIYSLETKRTHMTKIKEELELDKFEQILFIDDNKHNVRDLNEFGVRSFLIKKNKGESLNFKTMSQALTFYEKRMRY